MGRSKMVEGDKDKAVFGFTSCASILIGSLAIGTALHSFFCGLGLAHLSIILFGFAQSFFLRRLNLDIEAPERKKQPWRPRKITMLFMVHGCSATAWFFLVPLHLVLLNSPPAWHRILTDLTHLVYAAVCVSGTWVALDAYKRRMPNLVNTKPLPYVILNLTELFGYAVCYPLAVYYDTAHQDTGAYARLILFASTCLILPAAARFVRLIPGAPKSSSMVILSAICAMMATNDMLTLGYFPLASIVGQVGSVAPLIV